MLQCFHLFRLHGPGGIIVAPRAEELPEVGCVPEAYVDELDPRVGVERVVEPMEEVEEVILNKEDPTKVIQVGKNLLPNIWEKGHYEEYSGHPSVVPR